MSLGRLAEEASPSVHNTDFREIQREPEDAAFRHEASQWRSLRALAEVRMTQLLRKRPEFFRSVFLPIILNFIGISNMSSSEYPGQVPLNLFLYPALAFGTSAIPFTMAMIDDKANKCKHVAIAQGLSLKSYWLGNFLGHYVVSLPVTVSLVVFLCLFRPASLPQASLLLIIVEAFLYPAGLLLYSYTFASCFSCKELAAKTFPLLNLFLVAAPTITVALLINRGGSYSLIAKIIHLLMSAISPTYALPGMMIYACHEQFPDSMSYFGGLSAAPLFLSTISFSLYGAILLWQDSRSYLSSRPAIRQTVGAMQDDDVLLEEQRVATSAPDQEPARYQNLSHSYRVKASGRWQEVHAVRGISLGVRVGECFGLLGPNGAGKTTTLSILTGEVRPATAGRASIFGYDVADAEELAKAYKLLGLCPQIDPLWPSLSGRQHLKFYGRIKGVPEARLTGTVDTLLYRLGLDGPHADKETSQYSGGMKRKLSVAIALIGRSPLLFLDEPSAAVDAGAKRHLWQVIKMRSATQTVVLTTHSMEEAEALCNRIAIQVKGKLRCLGTPSHIKKKYGSGYQLELFLKPGTMSSSSSDLMSQVSRVQAFVRTKLSSDAQLLEQHAGRCLFQLPPMAQNSLLTLGKIFSELQANLEVEGIADFSLTQPSLEQVFIRFAREQQDEHGQS